MSECLKNAISNFSDKIDVKKIEDIHKGIEDLFSESIAKKDAAAIRKEGIKALTKQREERLMKKFLIATNYYDIKKLEAQSDRIFSKSFESSKHAGKAAVEAIESLLFSNAKYGSASVESIRQSILNRYSIVDHEFRKVAGNKLALAIEDGIYDEQLLKALWELGDGKETTVEMQELKGVAKVFHKVNAMMSVDKASINPLYRHRKNYGATLSHNADRTRSMGFPAWAKMIKDNVDLAALKENALEWGLPLKKKDGSDIIDDILLATYERITEQESMFSLKANGILAQAKDPTKVMRAIAEGRMFKYKNAEGFAYVFKQVADGTVYDSIMQSINANARNMAMDQALGKIPLANLQLLKEKMLKKVTDVEHRKYAESYFNTHLDNLVNVAAGTLKAHENSLTRFVRNVKALSSSLLGSAPVTAYITDPIWGSVNYAGLSGENIFSKYGQSMALTFKNMSSEQRIETARLAGELIDDVSFKTLHQLMGSNVDASLSRKNIGILTKVADFGMKISGMRLQNLIAKTAANEAFAFGVGHELSGKAGKNSNFVSWLKRYNMDDADLALLKLAIDKKGRVFQEGIRNVELNKALAILEKSDKVPFAGTTATELISGMDTTDLRKNQIEGAKQQIKKISWTEDKIKNYLSLLATRYSAASYDMARLSSPTPTGYTNYKMTLGLGTDTPAGAAVNLLMQFKAFSGGVVRNYRFLKNVDNVHAPTRRISQLVALLTVAGGVRLMIDDVLNGKLPRDPTAIDEENPVMNNFLTQALIKGGAAPFIADYGFTDYAQAGSSIQKDILGPTGRTVQDVYDIFAEAVTAPFDKDGFSMKKLVSPGLRWSPFTNLWYTKGAINALFQDDLKTVLDPKAARRKAKALKANSGYLWEQEQIVEPLEPFSNF